MENKYKVHHTECISTTSSDGSSGESGSHTADR